MARLYSSKKGKASMKYVFTQAYVLVGSEGFPFPIRVWIIGFQVKVEFQEIWQGVFEKYEVFSAAYLCELERENANQLHLMLVLREEPTSDQLRAVELIAKELNAHVTFPGNISLENNRYANQGEFAKILQWMEF